MINIGEQWKQTVTEFVNANATPIVFAILTVVVFIIGIMLMTGKKNRQSAGEWVPWVFLGTGVVLGGASIVTALTTAFKF